MELEGATHLPNGARLEVRPDDQPTTVEAVAPGGMDTAEAEGALLRDLIAAGLLEEPPAGEFSPDEPFEPVTVRGEPLSAQIIRERR